MDPTPALNLSNSNTYYKVDELPIELKIEIARFLHLPAQAALALVSRNWRVVVGGSDPLTSRTLGVKEYISQRLKPFEPYKNLTFDDLNEMSVEQLIELLKNDFSSSTITSIWETLSSTDYQFSEALRSLDKKELISEVLKFFADKKRGLSVRALHKIVLSRLDKFLVDLFSSAHFINCPAIRSAITKYKIIDFSTFVPRNNALAVKVEKIRVMQNSCVKFRHYHTKYNILINPYPNDRETLYDFFFTVKHTDLSDKCFYVALQRVSNHYNHFFLDLAIKRDGFIKELIAPLLNSLSKWEIKNAVKVVLRAFLEGDPNAQFLEQILELLDELMKLDRPDIVNLTTSMCNGNDKVLEKIKSIIVSDPTKFKPEWVLEAACCFGKLKFASDESFTKILKEIFKKEPSFFFAWFQKNKTFKKSKALIDLINKFDDPTRHELLMSRLKKENTYINAIKDFNQDYYPEIDFFRIIAGIFLVVSLFEILFFTYLLRARVEPHRSDLCDRSLWTFFL